MLRRLPPPQGLSQQTELYLLLPSHPTGASLRLPTPWHSMSPGTGLSRHRSRHCGAPPSEFPKDRMGMSTATPVHLTSQTTHPLLPLVFFPSEPIRPPQINTPHSQGCFPYYLPKNGPNDRFLYLAHLPVRAKSLPSSFTVDSMGAAER